MKGVTARCKPAIDALRLLPATHPVHWRLLRTMPFVLVAAAVAFLNWKFDLVPEPVMVGDEAGRIIVTEGGTPISTGEIRLVKSEMQSWQEQARLYLQSTRLILLLIVVAPVSFGMMDVWEEWAKRRVARQSSNSP